MQWLLSVKASPSAACSRIFRTLPGFEVLALLHPCVCVGINLFHKTGMGVKILGSLTSQVYKHEL